VHPASPPGRPGRGHGRPGRAHGRPGRAHGRPESARGRPGAEHGRPESAHGHPESEHGHPESDHGRPESAHGRPGAEHGRPESAHGHPESEQRTSGIGPRASGRGRRAPRIGTRAPGIGTRAPVSGARPPRFEHGMKRVHPLYYSQRCQSCDEGECPEGSWFRSPHNRPRFTGRPCHRQRRLVAFSAGRDGESKIATRLVQRVENFQLPIFNLQCSSPSWSSRLRGSFSLTPQRAAEAANCTAVAPPLHLLPESFGGFYEQPTQR
jgi:hypothetical protein